MTTVKYEGRTLDVWMDGNCQICQRSQRWCERRDPKGRVVFHDFRVVNDRSLPVARRDLEGSMWVRDADGLLLSGFAAWQRIIAELPGWRWLAGLSAIPPLSLVGPSLYRLVARNRHRLPAAITTPERVHRAE
jgi:predicted DCC family thiol-disulfide oxidoreductase YuxK